MSCSRPPWRGQGGDESKHKVSRFTASSRRRDLVSRFLRRRSSRRHFQAVHQFGFVAHAGAFPRRDRHPFRPGLPPPLAAASHLSVSGNYSACGLCCEIVQGGPQRVCGEGLLPQPRGQLGDAGYRVLCDALQDIDEVGIHVDAVQAASDDERLDDADVLRAEFCPAEVPVFRPMGTTLSARSRWFVSGDTSGSVRNTPSPARRSRT